jgi:hypothetical protein
MKTIVIGVMPKEQIRARARSIAIAKGEYKPKPGEPRIWFKRITNQQLERLADDRVGTSFEIDPGLAPGPPGNFLRASSKPRARA